MSDERWSIEETEIFLQLCIDTVKAGGVALIDTSPTVRNEHIYVELSKSLKKHGYVRKTMQLRHKYKRLKYNYKHAKTTNTIEKCPFYKLIDDLFTQPITTNPNVKDNEKNVRHKNDDKTNQKCIVNSIVIDPSSTEYPDDANNYEAHYYNNIIQTDLEEDYDYDNEILAVKNVAIDTTTNKIVRNYWQIEEVKKFIDLCIADNWYTQIMNTRLNAHLYKDLSKSFLEKTGHFRNPEQIRNKLRRLRILHKKSTKNIFSSELPRTFYGLLNILFDPKNISPKIECLEPYKRHIRSNIIGAKPLNTNNEDKDDVDYNPNPNKQHRSVRDIERWPVSETMDFLKLCINIKILERLRLNKGISSQLYLEIAKRHNLQSNGKYKRSAHQIALKLKRLKGLYAVIRNDVNANKKYPYFGLLSKLFTMDVNQILSNEVEAPIMDVPEPEFKPDREPDHIEVNAETNDYITKTETIIENSNGLNDEMIICGDDPVAAGDNKDKMIKTDGEEEIDQNLSATTIDDMKNIRKNNSSMLMMKNFDQICNRMKNAQLTLQENFFKQQQTLIDNQYKYELELQKREDHRFSDFLISLSSIVVPNQQNSRNPTTITKVGHNYVNDYDDGDEIYDYDDVAINNLSNNRKVVHQQQSSTTVPPFTIATSDPSKVLKIIQIDHVTDEVYNENLIDENLNDDFNDVDADFNDVDDDDFNDVKDDDVNNVIDDDDKVDNKNDGDNNEGNNDDGIIEIADESGDEINDELSDSDDKESPIDPKKLKSALACFMCTAVFFSGKQLNEHVHYDHEQPNLTCYKCEYKFDSVELLNDHWQFHKKGKRHLLRGFGKKYDDGELLCAQCGKTLANKKQFWAHIRRHDSSYPRKNKKRIGSCPICGKTMLKNSLRSHILIHTGKKPHKCEFCGKSFQQRSTLNLHRRMHTGRNYECLECNKRFVSAILLKYHSRSHAEERLHPCEFCEKSYFTRQHLNQHVESNHLGGPAYECDICFHKIRSLASLKVHMFLHTGKPFKCELCPREFTLRYKYKRHIITVHKITDVVCINEMLQKERKKVN